MYLNRLKFDEATKVCEFLCYQDIYNIHSWRNIVIRPMLSNTMKITREGRVGEYEMYHLIDELVGQNSINVESISQLELYKDSEKIVNICNIENNGPNYIITYTHTLNIRDTLCSFLPGANETMRHICETSITTNITTYSIIPPLNIFPSIVDCSEIRAEIIPMVADATIVDITCDINAAANAIDPRETDLSAKLTFILDNDYKQIILYKFKISVYKFVVVTSDEVPRFRRLDNILR